jgi:dynein heavy chain
LLKIEKYTHDAKMLVERIEKVSAAAGSMWRWVLAIEKYAKAFKDIEPKRAKVSNLREKLKRSEDELN